MGQGEAYCESRTAVCAGAVRSVTKRLVRRFCMTDEREQNLLIPVYQILNRKLNVLRQCNDLYLTKELDTKILFEWLILATTEHLYITRALWTPHFYYCVTNSPSLTPTRSHINPIHIHKLSLGTFGVVQTIPKHSAKYGACFETCCIPSVRGLLLSHPNPSMDCHPFRNKFAITLHMQKQPPP